MRVYERCRARTTRKLAIRERKSCASFGFGISICSTSYCNMESLYQKCADLLYKISPLSITRESLLQLKALHQCVKCGPNEDVYVPETAINDAYYEWIAWKNESNVLTTALAGDTDGEKFKSFAQAKFVMLLLHFLHQLPLVAKPALPQYDAAPVAALAVLAEEGVESNGKKRYCVIGSRSEEEGDFGRVVRLRRIK